MNKFSFIFPGQGSQEIGMGQYLYNEFKIARTAFEEASDALSLDMKKLCFESTPETLSLTENTQPALLTTSMATVRVLKNELGIEPEAVSGHSIGEYAAFTTGESLSFKDSVQSVRARGRYMQSAVPQGLGGMMALIGFTQAQAEFICRFVTDTTGFKPLSPANFNCEGQIVISGNLKAIQWLKENFKPEFFLEKNEIPPQKARLIPLQVSAPFHCELMKPAEEQMRTFFKDIQFKNSKIPIFQNFTAQAETQAEKLKENLILQISAPVQWTQAMIQMKNQGFKTFIECGHGSVLKGLLKKIDPEFKVLTTHSLQDLKLIEAELT